MRSYLRYFGIALQFLGVTLLMTLAVCGGLGALELIFLYYGFILFMFFHYRYLRQNELMYLLAGAADTQQPLTLRYGPIWQIVLAAPSAASGTPFFSRRCFQASGSGTACTIMIARCATWPIGSNRAPLAEALQSVPGLAPREMVLAASVGQKTGKLGETLRRVPKWRVATLWLDLMPRFLYPLFLLAAAFFVVTFVMMFIIPKFERIFMDFRAWAQLPAETRFFIAASRFIVRNSPAIFLQLFGLMALIQLMFWQPTLRWYVPIVNRFYRMHVQSRVLKMLGLLLETGQPIPQALSVLMETGYFRGTVYNRLSNVRDGVAHGGELADELQRQGLVRDSMVPLVRSAQKMNNLPWALGEMGDHQARRTLVAAQRLSQVFFPIAICVLALMIGFVALSMFSPLLALLQGLENMPALHPR